MQKEHVIQFHKTINKLLCNLSFAGQYIYLLSLKEIDPEMTEKCFLLFLLTPYNRSCPLTCGAEIGSVWLLIMVD